jgi:acetyl esterase/lipase
MRFWLALLTLALSAQLSAQAAEETGLWFARVPVLTGGGDIDLRLDVYRPEGAGPFPVLVLLHGGSYVAGDRSDHAGLARAFAARGVAVVSPDLRRGFVADALTETDAESAGLADVTAVFRWIRDHASAYSLDAGRVFVGGESSGGHLSLAVGALYPLQTEQPVRLRGILDLYGGEFGEHWGPRSVPVVIVQGTLDQACLPEAGLRMADRLEHAGTWYTFVLNEGMYHSWEGRWVGRIVDLGTQLVAWTAPGSAFPPSGRHLDLPRPE